MQKELAEKVVLEKRFSAIRLVAGADIAIDAASGEGLAGVIVYTYPDLDVVEKVHARVKIKYPYIPGLLSFRESPVLIEAMRKVRNDPDLILFDGQGIAHPRGLGIASHMGLVLDKPTIGCAKSLLVGTFRDPDEKTGSTSPLVYKNRTVGSVVRTRDGVRPIFVSPGHGIDIPGSVEIVLRCSSGYRVPRPTRDADLYVGEIKRGQAVGQVAE